MEESTKNCSIKSFFQPIEENNEKKKPQIATKFEYKE